MKVGLGFSRGLLYLITDMLAVQWSARLHESSLPSEAHSATDTGLNGEQH
jgi:hypothetical protein